MRSIGQTFLYGSLTVLGVMSLAGCGGGGGGGASTLTQLTASTQTPSGLTARLAEDQATSPVGGIITYTMTLTNNTPRPITYLPVLLSDGPTPQTGSSLHVLDPTGENVSHSGTQFDPSNVGPALTVSPGQTISAGNMPIALTTAGRYKATAVFTLKSSSSAAARTTMVGPVTSDAL